MPTPLRFDRRALLSLGAAGLAGLGLSRLGRAGDAPAARRRFLFVHNYGGWDTTYVFQPNFGASGVDMEPTATAAEAHGIPFVDSGDRPSVRRFFEDFGDRACVINGVEVRSVTHERCSRIVMTGRADADADDWGATLAAQADDPGLLPYLVISGTAFTSAYADRIVRVGTSGQLADLLSGDALLRSDAPIRPPPERVQDAVDDWLTARAASLAPGSPMAAAFAAAHADQVALRARGPLRLDAASTGCTRIAADLRAALDAFEAGLARSALVQYTGWCNLGWDTHANNERQGTNFEELFDVLTATIRDLDRRTAPGGGRLADEVVLVVLSEMGRSPKLNRGGRSHWTFTSTMLFGAGVRGGRAIGGFDEGGFGLGVDLDSGETHDAGVVLQAANVGATLLALGDVDPGETAPIRAVIR